MSISTQGLLTAVEPWLAERLVPRAARERIHALAGSMPLPWNVRLFECRLGADAERVDFQVCAMRQDGVQEALREALADGAGRYPALGPAAPLLEAWVQPGTLVQRDIPVLWLEYDFVPGRPVEPFVFVSLDPGYLAYLDPGQRTPPPVPAAHVRALAEESLRLVPRWLADSRKLDTLERCTRALPEGARMFSLAAMPQRGTQDLRAVAAVPPPEVPSWLERVEWPGEPRLLRTLLELIGRERYEVSVYVDVGERVRPGIAFEFGPSLGSPGWRPFMERLVALGLSAPDKARAALEWMGSARVQVPGATWPVTLARHLTVKLVAHADGALEAKAYLMLMSRYTLL